MKKHTEAVLELCLVVGFALLVTGISFKLGWETGLIVAGAALIFIGLPSKGGRRYGLDKRHNKTEKPH